MLGAALAGLPAVLRLGLAPSWAAEEIFDDDRILGAPEAPVTIIEYSSLTCPHCANFHKNVLPEVKENWIGTGRARLVYRHFPLDGLALRAALVANCIDGDRHFSFIDALFRGQKVWSRSNDPVAALAQVAALAGLDRAAFDACIANEAEMDRILGGAKHAQDTYKVDSTPTFIVNGRKVQNAAGYEEFNKLLENSAEWS
jgi:protein-disulfide isomerase